MWLQSPPASKSATLPFHYMTTLQCASFDIPGEGKLSPCLSCEGNAPSFCYDCGGAGRDEGAPLDYGLYATEEGQCLKVGASAV
jgi:hypothetical protein